MTGKGSKAEPFRASWLRTPSPAFVGPIGSRVFPNTGFTSRRSKEKFRTLRYYISGGNDRIHRLIGMAEVLSNHICEYCGRCGSHFDE